jgi:hypothetical protein
MEGEQKFQGGVEALEYDGELESERAIEKAMDEVERRLGKDVKDASPEERIAVTTELLREIDERYDNKDRFIVEVYAGLRKMAELERDYHEANARFDAVLR